MRTKMRTATGMSGKRRNDTEKSGRRLMAGLKKLSGTLNRCSRQIYNDLRTVTPLGWR